MTTTTSPLQIFAQGLRDGLPLGITYFVLAWSVGHYAVAVLGFLPAYVSAQSLLMFSAQGQIASLKVLGAGGGVALAVLVALFVNMRFMLMSAALAPYFRGNSLGPLFLTAHVIGNGPFAIAMRRFVTSGGQVSYLAGVGLAGYAGYGIGTLTGAYLGGVLPRYLTGPASFALPAFLVTLIVAGLSAGKARMLALAALSGVFTLAGAATLGSNAALIVGPIAAATICTWWTHGRR